MNRAPRDSDHQTSLIVSFVLLLTPLAALPAAEAPQPLAKPNVLFIAIDDLRTSLGCYGDHAGEIPEHRPRWHSSRLFNRAYTPPSRLWPVAHLYPDRPAAR